MASVLTPSEQEALVMVHAVLGRAERLADRLAAMLNMEGTDEYPRRRRDDWPTLRGRGCPPAGTPRRRSDDDPPAAAP